MAEAPLDEIHRVMDELDDTRGQLKTLREGLRDVLAGNDDYKQLQSELDELKTKRAELKQALDEDKDYVKVNSELEELKFKYKDLQDIMSAHLVNYYNETQSTSIKDPGGEVRPVIISARIGKPGEAS